ncbi:MAG: hypothetical protein HC880_16750 [Bacteroidia bacterium]|nr:hypothetical protein [Bacteroidia bacterium]
MGLKPGLWFYNIARNPSGKGLRYWIKNNLGEEPVLYNPEISDQVVDLITRRLANEGHFRAEVTFEEKVKGKRDKKVELLYKVYLYKPYLIDSLVYPSGDTPPTGSHLFASQQYPD